MSKVNRFKKNYGSQQEGYGKAFLQRKLVLNRYRNERKRFFKGGTGANAIELEGNCDPEDEGEEEIVDKFSILTKKTSNNKSFSNKIKKTQTLEKHKNETSETDTFLNENKHEVDRFSVLDTNTKKKLHKTQNLENNSLITSQEDKFTVLNKSKNFEKSDSLKKKERKATVTEQQEHGETKNERLDQNDSSEHVYKSPKKKISKLDKAKLEYKQKQEAKLTKKQQIEKRKLEKEEAIKKYKEKKLRKFKILNKKTKKGQPVMSGRMELLLESIEEMVGKKS